MFYKKILINIRYINKKVKNFLGRSRSKELLTFLFFLCLSFLFWVLQSVNEEGDGNFVIPVEYKNVPENVVFTNTPVENVSVKLRGRGMTLISHRLTNYFKPIEIDFPQYDNQTGLINIKEEQIYNVLKKQILSDISLVSITPDTINIMYSSEGAKMIPVKFDGSISSKTQMLVGDKIVISPDSVKVYAPKGILDTIKYVSTLHVDLYDLGDTTIQSVGLRKLYGTKIIPSQVKVTVPVEEYTEKVLSVPVGVIGLPDSLTLRVFPSQVSLSCFVVLSEFKDISASDFEVSVLYSELIDNPDMPASLNVVRKPENVTNVNITPITADFIIEEND